MLFRGLLFPATTSFYIFCCHSTLVSLQLSMAIDSVVASETSRELRIETRLKKCSCGGRQSSGSSSSNSSATTMTSSSGGSSTGEYYLFQ